MRPVLDGLFVRSAGARVQGDVTADRALGVAARAVPDRYRRSMRSRKQSCIVAGLSVRWACMRTAPLVILASALAGCFVPEGRHTIRFELAQEPPGPVVTDRKSFFFWGLVPTVKVDVRDKCPNGAVAIVDGSDAGGTPWIPTLGLWSRRATTYYCRQPPSSDVPQ